MVEGAVVVNFTYKLCSKCVCMKRNQVNIVNRVGLMVLIQVLVDTQYEKEGYKSLFPYQLYYIYQSISIYKCRRL